MIDRDEIVTRILTSASDTINLIVIFGSQARGDETKHSDLDVAVSTSLLDKQQRIELRLKLISLFDGPNQRVDVVITEDASWSLKYRIATDGVILFQQTEDSWPNFVEKVLIYYPDFRIIEQKFLSETLGES